MEENKIKQKKLSVRRMVLCSLFAALTAVCAWLSIPVADIAFTMQTFAVFLTLGILGGKWGTVSILIYLMMGIVGLPVFSGFQGGIGTLLGVTGGYIWGFLFSGLIFWALERVSRPLAMAAGLLTCYACGSVWFLVYAGNASLGLVLLKCVVPYVIPDAVKLSMALTLSTRISRQLKMKL